MGREEALDGDLRLASLEEVGSLLLASCSGIIRLFGSCTWASDAFWQLVFRYWFFLCFVASLCENRLAH